MSRVKTLQFLLSRASPLSRYPGCFFFSQLQSNFFSVFPNCLFISPLNRLLGPSRRPRTRKKQSQRLTKEVTMRSQTRARRRARRRSPTSTLSRALSKSAIGRKMRSPHTSSNGRTLTRRGRSGRFLPPTPLPTDFT